MNRDVGAPLTLRDGSLSLETAQQQTSSQARLPAAAQGVPSRAVKQQKRKVPFMATASSTGSLACAQERTLRTQGLWAVSFLQLPTPWNS